MPQFITSRRNYDTITGLGFRFGARDGSSYVMEFACDDTEDAIADALAGLAEQIRARSSCGVSTARAIALDEEARSTPL